MKEIWKLVSEIPGYEEFVGYRVSDLGNFETRKRPGAGGKLQDSWRRIRGRSVRGYVMVSIGSPDGSVCVTKRSALILSAFIGHRPEGQLARHLNDIKNDDRLENLAWGTQKQNKDDELRNGNRVQGERHHNKKLTETQVREIFRRAWAAEDQHALAREFGIGNSNVSMIRKGHAWKHLKLIPPEDAPKLKRPGASGEKQYLARLADDQAREIFRRVRAGESGSKIAEEFGVGRGVVSSIKNKKSWVHIHESSVR